MTGQSTDLHLEGTGSRVLGRLPSLRLVAEVVRST